MKSQYIESATIQNSGRDIDNPHITNVLFKVKTPCYINDTYVEDTYTYPIPTESLNKSISVIVYGCYFFQNRASKCGVKEEITIPTKFNTVLDPTIPFGNL